MAAKTMCIAGGHGAVTQLTVDGRLQAVKSAHQNDRNSARRLRFEAAQLAALSHASFPRSRGLTETPHGPVLHMDWVEGLTVDALIAQRPMLSPDASLLLVADVCAALADANQDIGLVHRDIKPANLMVNRSGNIIIVDLGCARSLAGDPDGTGEIVGTLGYMAPERLDGGRHGTHVDVYGAGMVLLELLCGGRVGHRAWGTALDAPRVGSVSSERHHLGILYALRAADQHRKTSLNRAIWAAAFSMLAWAPSNRPALRDAAQELRGLVTDERTARAELSLRIAHWLIQEDPRQIHRPTPNAAHRFAAQVGAVAAMAACMGFVLLMTTPPYLPAAT